MDRPDTFVGGMDRLRLAGLRRSQQGHLAPDGGGADLCAAFAVGQPADADYLRFAQSPVLGRKDSDEFAVLLCRAHYREVHRCGEEADGGERPRTIRPAGALWRETHPMSGRSSTVANL